MLFTAVRMLVRDWRGGELGILVAALVLAVGLVSGVSAFATRLQSALEQESHRFLAADMVVRAGVEMPGEWLQEARARGLRVARTLSFPTMVFGAGDEMYLASVKAVSEGYPLRGELAYSGAPFGESTPAGGLPATGQAWMDSRLFALLGVATGGQVGVGDSSLQVAGAVRGEPDQGVGVYGYGPRLLMRLEDIPATGVVQTGSRVEYRQLYAGPQDSVQAFREWLEPRLQPGQRLLGVGDSQPGIGRALERAERFLLLAGSLGVVLAGVAIALAAGRFSERHTDFVAILKSLGSTSGEISRLYGTSLFLLALGATALGCLLGWGIQAIFFALFSGQLPVQPGPAGWRPYLFGGATALACVFAFAWPPVRRLAGANPLRVLRRDLPSAAQREVGDYLLGLFAVCLLMLWYSADWRLTLALVAGLVLIVALGMGAALLLLRGGRGLGMRAGSIWRLSLAGLQRRGVASALQAVVFGVAIMLLLVLVAVRTSLLDEWRLQLPADAPNHFLLNIAPAEVGEVEDLLRRRGIASQPLYPMIRGRLMAIDGQPLPTREEAGEDEAYQRESNFTWSAGLPGDNRLLSGQWWPADSDAALVSVESDYAAGMGLEVGDTLGLRIGERELEVTVASIRELDWETMRPNFFLVFPPRLLASFPATYMTSFHLAPENKRFLNQLLREFPTVTVIEMDEVVEQLRDIIAQVSAAVEMVLLVILATGALVLVAGVQASLDERMLEGAILRALGARRGLLLGGLAIEFAALGLCAGLLAAVSAEVAVGLLQTWALGMQYAPSPWLWPLGPAMGAILIVTLGLYSTRRVATTPPTVLLREL